jgi:DNA polymerase III epsilon subunit-like protein
MAIIILDTETLGRKKEEDRICELALLVHTDDTGWEAFSDLASNEENITSNAMAVHHITHEMVEDALPLKRTEAFKMLEKLNRPENTLVIQNAPFDLGVLANHDFVWQGMVVDTLVCAKHLLATQRHALQYLRYELGLYRHEKIIADALGVKIEAHRALSDVIVTKLLLNHLLEHVEDNMDALIELSNQPALLKSVGFGKYRGQSFEAVVATDRDYFIWCLENFQKLSKEARTTIEYWLAQ